MEALHRVSAGADWPLFDVATTRRIEYAALHATVDHALMQRAGLATARLALALAPHADTVWIAAGPGNNGGDGLEAAGRLQAWGKHAVVTWMGTPATASPATAAALQRAQDAGVSFAAEPPAGFNFCIDALLGIGAARAPEGRMAQWITLMHARGAPVLAVDIPTGLNADTGLSSAVCVRALATLCLLTLKPGLFTCDGRDATRQVWLDSLGMDLQGELLAPLSGPTAVLQGAPAQRCLPHASHKGSFGDVAVVGGAPGMSGAALLAGSAALHCGAGRVFLALLDTAAMSVDPLQPELMLRRPEQLNLAQLTVVCGCGGGDAVRALLPRVLSTSRKLVLDADALNAVAADSQLRAQLRARSTRHPATVVTPHPLEAARLLSITAREVQQDRLAAARQLADELQCVVVLKGSGSVIAAPGQAPRINPTGNARLATAGTGDVLAGAIGAGLAAGRGALQAAREAVYLHGECADRWAVDCALTASDLARSLRASSSFTQS